MDVVNRFHAWPGPRKIVDFATNVCMLAFMVIPLVVLASWSELEPTLLTNSPFSVFSLKAYLMLCAGWGAMKLVISWAFRYAANNSATLIEWKQAKADLTAPFSDDDLHGNVSKFLTKVPGNQVLKLSIDCKRLAIPNLNQDLEGLRIAHISDLHMTGRIGPKWYEYVTEQVNQLEPDVIAITGDIVENEACWSWLANSLGKLSAKHGVYFILGNHDFYIDTNKTTKLLEDLGLICLSNRRVEVEWNGVPVILAGNERPWQPRVADLSATADEKVGPAPLRLFLMHSPDEIDWACQQQAGLALAGHTHGGQLRFPVLGPIACPSRYGTRYACGVFRHGDTVMHVTRGVSGKTPLRWNCPPEIALLELVRS